MYVDHINGEKCIITELARRGIPSGVTNINYCDTEVCSVYVYPSTYVAISAEAREIIKRIIRTDRHWKWNAFEADYTFETDNYKSGIGLFGFLPKKKEGETVRKKIYYLKDELRVDTSKLWYHIMDKMPTYDNEYLKNLDLTVPLDDGQ